MTTFNKIGYIRYNAFNKKDYAKEFDDSFTKVFCDTYSKTDISIPEFNTMLNYIRKDDSIVIPSFDKLALSSKELYSLIIKLLEKEVYVLFKKENLLLNPSKDKYTKLKLSVIKNMIDFEKNLRLERQREGIEIAKKNHKYKGSVKKLQSEKIKEIKLLFSYGVSPTKISNLYNISRQSVYNYIKD